MSVNHRFHTTQLALKLGQLRAGGFILTGKPTIQHSLTLEGCQQLIKLTGAEWLLKLGQIRLQGLQLLQDRRILGADSQPLNNLVQHFHR